MHFNQKKKMMSKLSKKEVEHIARLSRLKLADKEIEKYTNQLSEVLEYVSQINELDTSELKSQKSKVTAPAKAELRRCGRETQNLLAIDLSNISRKDKVGKKWDREKLLKNAPSQKDGFFVVPEVFKK